MASRHSARRGSSRTPSARSPRPRELDAPRRRSPRRPGGGHYDLNAMTSAPPPPPGGAGRTMTIAFESGRRLAPDALPISPNGASLEVDGLLREALRLTL